MRDTLKERIEMAARLSPFGVAPPNRKLLREALARIEELEREYERLGTEIDQHSSEREDRLERAERVVAAARRYVKMADPAAYKRLRESLAAYDAEEKP
jgi:hypothetical protein